MLAEGDDGGRIPRDFFRWGRDRAEESSIAFTTECFHRMGGKSGAAFAKGGEARCKVDEAEAELGVGERLEDSAACLEGLELVQKHIGV